ncbi:hypothetical protein WOLCODRAFT_155840 [Wolfiporia cocos MD-104 SS10]|uniref:Uncharacterized protein n=1 Tax=Wolfiporia cocos (strain MD-104) TaxID=742152 RepID=A0A2H3J5X5_WOLCO|nr:hypothetical protein WOLCODRAFT_155840 [Wolfiporia cocos MD-104 SS10]
MKGVSKVFLPLTSTSKGGRIVLSACGRGVLGPGGSDKTQSSVSFPGALSSAGVSGLRFFATPLLPSIYTWGTVSSARDFSRSDERGAGSIAAAERTSTKIKSGTRMTAPRRVATRTPLATRDAPRRTSLTQCVHAVHALERRIRQRAHPTAFATRVSRVILYPAHPSQRACPRMPSRSALSVHRACSDAPQDAFGTYAVRGAHTSRDAQRSACVLHASRGGRDGMEDGGRAFSHRVGAGDRAAKKDPQIVADGFAPQSREFGCLLRLVLATPSRSRTLAFLERDRLQHCSLCRRLPLPSRFLEQWIFLQRVGAAVIVGGLLLENTAAIPHTMAGIVLRVCLAIVHRGPCGSSLREWPSGTGLRPRPSAWTELAGGICAD